MENYTLYSHSADFDRILSLFTKRFPKIAPEVEVKDDEKTIYAVLKGGLFGKNKELKINYRQRAIPSHELTTDDCPVSKQLIGMYNFVNSIPAKNKEIKLLLLRKIETINSETAFMATPSLSPEMQGLLLDLTGALDAIVFALPGLSFSDSKHQHFLDKTFNLLLDTEGNTGKGVLNVQIETKYWNDLSPASEEQLERKARTEALLREKYIKINTHLPVVPKAADTRIREKEEIIERAYSLMLLTAKGEGLEWERIEAIRQDFSINGLTPAERAVYSSTQLTKQDKLNTLWRYESLNVLLWSLGLTDEMSYPSAICNVSLITQLLLRQSQPQLEASVQRRSVDVLLDELDKVYRMNWACVDARVCKQQPTGELNASVVYERHYALNWLTGYQGQEWDDVTTDT